ncbi:redoxin domain-containing protein (plasmid) [Rubrobacter tropicus]|uniref:Redoxin domain-containing protein n=1 Tax=Rubrobacter tropicus TaxID=2653851 RepID=A0A6G8QG50_9ACTN|nr:redoxin domain-containing protein [Rubrobacter tropicus]QIN85381.1 redoxin domain-containing protein [Rubrobacter tropicus]
MSTGTPKTSDKAKKTTPKKPKTVRRGPGLGLVLVFAAILLPAVAGLGAIFVLSAPEQPASAGGQAGRYPIQVGDPGPGEEAPPMKLESAQGDTFDLSQKRGETVLLYFQEGLGCQPCWDQIRDIEANMGGFEELGIDEVASITNNPPDALEQKVEDEGISTPVLTDPNLAASKTYDTNSYGMMGGSTNGHTFIVVGPDGEIRWRADYGGAPDYTMYVPAPDLLADMRAGLEKGSS